MSKVTDLIQRHHHQLGETLLGRAHALVEGADPDPDSFVTFLKTDLLPHAAGEERALYPHIDRLVAEHGKPTATMNVDHEYINAYVEEIAKTADALKRGTASERAQLARRLGLLALRLDAIVELHTEKEERVYLPLIERYLSDAEQEKLLEELHAQPSAQPRPVHTCGHHHHDHDVAYEDYGPGKVAGPGESLDVRRIAPPQRHPLVFDSFKALGPAQFFVLVNDHDPRPLRYHFETEHPGEFTWEYLEQGPEVWRVRIGRTG